MKKQFEDMVDGKIDAILSKRGYVLREEFEVTRKMAQKAREEQEILAKKIEEIEKKLS
jgi:BMFP domain-containing protein YqiC